MQLGFTNLPVNIFLKGQGSRYTIPPKIQMVVILLSLVIFCHGM